MRYIKVSIVPLSLFLLAASSLPAGASTDFEDWAAAKVGEMDSRWERVTAREAGVSLNSAREIEAPPGLSTAARSGRTFRRAGWPSGVTASGAAAIDGSAYTKRGSYETLKRSTRERNGATRGVGKLSSPAQAVRASSADRRLPGNTSAKYRRTVGSGRAGAWRRSPRMGQRMSSGRTSRRGSASSGLRGATRMRRSAR